MLNVRMPDGARMIIERLSEAGIRSWLVGGCVRDMLRHRLPNDWDIAAGANPEDIVAALEGLTVIPTGIKHGTVTVVTEEECFEITACRCDGEYKDMRRPDSVSFTNSIESDLSRRDFTINAMAYSEKDGLIDLFGGRSDLNKKIIRCVGDPTRRFSEDALRIMRALRFSSELGFEIEENTAAAAFALKENLDAVSQERKLNELRRLLLGSQATRVLIDYRDIILKLLPECEGLVGLAHRVGNPDDLWTHCARSVDLAPQKFNVRLAVLLRDIGKPYCKREGDVFANHALVGAQIAEHMLRRLTLDRAALREIVTLIANHSLVPEADEKIIKRLLNKLGAGTLLDLYNLRRCDRAAHMDEREREELEAVENAYVMTRRIIERGDCYMLSTLDIHGEDLVELGFSGADIGTELNRLLMLVIDGECPNKREELLKRVDMKNKSL